MVDKPIDITLARIAEAGSVARGTGEEVEGTLWIEGVTGDGGWLWKCTMLVQVVVAEGALEPRANASFFATVALERELRVFEPELVLWVAKMS